MPRPPSPMLGHTIVYLAHIEFPGPDGRVVLLKPGITWDWADRLATYKQSTQDVARRAGIVLEAREIFAGYFCGVMFSGFMHYDLAAAVERLVIGSCRYIALEPFGDPWSEWFRANPDDEAQVRSFLVGYAQRQVWDTEPLFYHFHDEERQWPYHRAPGSSALLSQASDEAQILTPNGPIDVSIPR